MDDQTPRGLDREEALRRLDAELGALRRQRKSAREGLDPDGPIDIAVQLARVFFYRGILALALTLFVIMLFANTCGS